jgi:hypothetical protein
MNNKDEGQLHLAFVVGELKEGETEPTTNISAIEAICHDSLERDKHVISEYHNSQKLIDCVQLNIQEFLQVVVDYTADFLETKDMTDGKFDFISLNFSRLFLNILSMFRSMLDHSDVSISRGFGKESEQFRRWKKTLSDQYDSSIEYRLFYKLRNYSQHVGMPPMQISFSDVAEQEGISFRLDFMRDKLLEERSCWNKQLIHDLEASPEKIPVLDSLNNWGECFKTISNTLLDIKRNEALEAAEKIVGHRERLDLPREVGKLCTILLPSKKVETGELKLNLNWLPEDHALQIVEGTPFNDAT